MAAGVQAAQADVLQDFAKKMGSVKSFSVRFAYLVQNGSHIETSESGSLTASGAKYRLELGGSLIVFDGAARYTYLKAENEIIIETPNPLRDGIFADPSAIFAINYNDFDIKRTSAGSEEAVFDLVPKQSGTPCTKITITINKTASTPSKIVYYDSNGRITALSISEFKINTKPSAADFIFVPQQYPQAEVVDMR